MLKESEVPSEKNDILVNENFKENDSVYSNDSVHPAPLSKKLKAGDTISFEGNFILLMGQNPDIRFLTEQNQALGVLLTNTNFDSTVNNIIKNQESKDCVFARKVLFRYEYDVDVSYYDKPLMCFSVLDIDFIDKTENTAENFIFKDSYPSDIKWNENFAEPVLDTEMKRNYRTIITKASRLPPDFNGKYKIAKFGAGTSAYGFFIINLENGVVTEGFPFEFSLDYSLDSKLIIRNPKKEVLDYWVGEVESREEIPDWYITEYYLFEDEEFSLLKSERVNQE
ncbi:MAG: hypothetical protein PUC37_11955 [Spirochaetales bacterium]|nr:hypothetical protein [Spirochaetales bacterium]